MKRLILLLFLSRLVSAEVVTLPGLRQPVEILRDRWGVPHIYAQTVDDLFFAQGYMAARDRLFQIDLWRRTAAGELSEILGPSAVERDTLARSVRYRGDMNAEWQSYGPETKRIAIAFTNGINAYIRSLKQPPVEFRIAGYQPSLWTPEDCISRVAGLLMTRNLRTEVNRAVDTRLMGVEKVKRYRVLDPPVDLRVPAGLDLAAVTPEVLRIYNEMVGGVRMQGSNNWVVDGTMTVTGKPILASDPHRPVQIPSLRKTVHLVGPGWNVIGAGEPALPGVALGHNEHIGFGFTIVGIDQQDLYVEKIDPSDRNRYFHRGQWRQVGTEKAVLKVKGSAAVPVEMRYTVHGPIMLQDSQSAIALRWVGTEPGTAGYLAALSLAQARNWKEFTAAAERYKVPSENLVYADVQGNIGWHATGLTPVRKNWNGLYPVPGDGAYEWSGFLPAGELPRLYNPGTHWIATANHNILPPGYPHTLGFEWAAPFRYLRVKEMLSERKKFSVADFERMQQDVVSLPARRFQEVLRQWRGVKTPKQRLIVDRMLQWDARLNAESVEALIYEVWMSALPFELTPDSYAQSAPLPVVLRMLESRNDRTALSRSLDGAIEYLEKQLGADPDQWKWGRVHQIEFRHPLGRSEFNRGPVARPGDANTVNSTSGAALKQTDGASYRHILDLSDWDKSVMTNVPGESGDPSSPHYSDLLEPWSKGVYHPMPFTRKAVEAAMRERIELRPGR